MIHSLLNLEAHSRENKGETCVLIIRNFTCELEAMEEHPGSLWEWNQDIIIRKVTGGSAEGTLANLRLDIRLHRLLN